MILCVKKNLLNFYITTKRKSKGKRQKAKSKSKIKIQKGKRQYNLTTMFYSIKVKRLNIFFMILCVKNTSQSPHKHLNENTCLPAGRENRVRDNQ